MGLLFRLRKLEQLQAPVGKFCQGQRRSANRGNWMYRLMDGFYEAGNLFDFSSDHRIAASDRCSRKSFVGF